MYTCVFIFAILYQKSVLNKVIFNSDRVLQLIERAGYAIHIKHFIMERYFLLLLFYEIYAFFTVENQELHFL